MPYGHGSTTDFMLRVAMGLVPGYLSVNKFGHNSEITTGTDPEDLWAGGAMYEFFPTTAQTVQAVSDSAEDGVAGTGGLASPNASWVVSTGFVRLLSQRMARAW